jgi:hypothetical protein
MAVSTHPTTYSEFIFRSKVSLLQLNRLARNLLKPLKRYAKTNSLVGCEAIAKSITPLWNYALPSNEPRNEIESERNLILGKIHNLRIAAQTIHSIEIPKDGIFSFWQYVGQPNTMKGYVKGREIRQGCMIPSIGGGLCQLSNALYSVALDAGFEILERHAHTQIIAGSLAEIGRDATVFWNYVDLRFRVTQAIRFEISLTSDSLIVQVKGLDSLNISPFIVNDSKARTAIDSHHDCLSCGVDSCFRHQNTQPQKQSEFSKTAYLVDEYWIEFDRYIQSQIGNQDLLAIPLNGKKWKKQNYAWNQEGFAQVKTATLLTLSRALATRKLSPQGQSLQTTLWKYDQKLAEYFSSLLSYEISHIVVMQNLLPFLWQNGSLQGRTFDVLMTRLPLAVLQKRLDFAYTLHPESLTLNDFRLNSEFSELETQALAHARHLITPHRAIAALFPEKVHLINWHIPEVKTPLKKGDRILFPASALGRKGAYELREVAKQLNLELIVLGNDLEGDRFWQDLTIHRSDANYLDEVGLVILPAFVENKPRILLNAIAHHIPVIASSACGLSGLVTEVPIGNVQALINAVEKLSTTFACDRPSI